MDTKIKYLLTVVWLIVGSSTSEAAWTTKRLTNNAGSSRFSDVAVSGSNVYVVWEDDTPGNYDIFLIYSPLLK